jgi:hypothetical protein
MIVKSLSLSKKMSKHISQEIIIRGIKIIDIGYITTIYFCIGYIVSYYLNNLYENFDTNLKHDKFLLIIDIIKNIYIIGILFYIIRNIVSLVPFPFEGISGYQHTRVKELGSGGVALGFAMFSCQLKLRLKLDYVLGKFDHPNTTKH